MSDPAIDPAPDAFDAVELQGGLLMQVENVHERLRQARERHRVMRGNPFAEVSSGQVGELGVTVLGVAIDVEPSRLTPWCDEVVAARDMTGIDDELADVLFGR